MFLTSSVDAYCFSLLDSCISGLKVFGFTLGRSQMLRLQPASLLPSLQALKGGGGGGGGLV